MSRFFSPAALIGAAVLLSGCFVSEDPLIKPSDADHPFAASLSYVGFRDEEGSWKEDETGVLDRAGDFYLMRTGDEANPPVLLFKSIRPNVYVAQQPDSGHYIYGLMQVAGNIVYEYGFSCDSTKDAAFIRSGAISQKDGDCYVKSLSDLAAIFQARVNSGDKPNRKYEIQ